MPLLSDGLNGKRFYYALGTGVDQNAAIGDFCRSDCFAKVNARVRGALVFGCHLPKRILDDDGRVAAYAKFQEQDAHVVVRRRKSW